MTLADASTQELFAALTGQYGEAEQLQMQHILNLFTHYKQELNIDEGDKKYELDEIRDMYLKGVFDGIDAGDEALVDRLLDLL